VFKESVSPDLISSMLVALRDHCTDDVTVRVLTGFQNTDGFNMTLQLLPQNDLDVMKSIFVKLQFSLENVVKVPVDGGCFTLDQLHHLRKVYKL
jgi:hypothetical protein